MVKNTGFNWERLGNLEKGRRTLGAEMPVAVYRLLQYTIKDEIAERSSAADAEDILRGAGYRAGQALARNMLDLTLEPGAFIAHLKSILLELKIGILNFENIDLDTLKFTLTVDEDLDCSGLPVTGDTVCFYDEGFIAGIFTLYTNRPMRAIEVDCWGTGATTCRFDISPK